jgi:hypothetical protein
MAESIKNAVGDVEQPGAEGEKQRLDQGQSKMHGADEEPRPESSDRWRIQAEQMPPFREVVDTTCQVSVYVCCQDESTLGFSPGPKGVKTGKSDRRGCARLFRPMVPDFLHEARPTDACAAFIKESRMEFVNARKLDRKSGCTLVRTWGAPVRFPPAFATAQTLAGRSANSQLSLGFPQTDLGGSVRLKRLMRLKGPPSRIYEG